MEITIVRQFLSEKSTIGKLDVDGVFQCFTLEDAVRDVKIPGSTAIDYGRYPVEVTFSNRFQRDLPLLVGVPNFSGVRIHPGNNANDTEGCILVGLDHGNNVIGRSREAFSLLFPLIQKSISEGDPVFISIEHGALSEPQPQTESAVT